MIKMEYPIIQMFNNDKSIYGQKKAPAIASVSLFYTFKDSIILDAKGYRYKVKSVNKIGWHYFLGYHPLIKGRTARIEYEFSEQEQLSLELFKQIVIEKLSESDSSYSKNNLELLIKKIEDATNYESIINCFIDDLD